ncbi:MAG: transcriptional repressor LexA [Fidelibacterota bacterium]
MFLTRRQREVLDFLEDWLDSEGYAPSYEEIAAHFGYRSKGTVYKHINNLMLKGVIKKGWNRSRSIELIKDEQPAAVELPLLGLVAAGAPIEAVEGEETIAVPADILGRGRHYVLRVRGNSMIDEQIRDGDYVIVEERRTAEDGETVIALINGSEATVKKFYRENGRVRLQPANPEMAPLVINAGDVQIQGVVIGILRKFC